MTGIVTSKNPHELIEAIEMLVKGENLIKKMGDAGIDRATEDFSLEKMLNTHMYAFATLVK
jgi:glycosyltransferase involved in cell wall biosynthesis